MSSMIDASTALDEMGVLWQTEREAQAADRPIVLDVRSIVRARFAHEHDRNRI